MTSPTTTKRESNRASEQRRRDAGTVKPRASRRAIRESRKCHHPGCAAEFMPNSPNQIYCDAHKGHAGETERRKAGVIKKRIRNKAVKNAPYSEERAAESWQNILSCRDPLTHKYCSPQN
jgi:Rieske Fe-S protein